MECKILHFVPCHRLSSNFKQSSPESIPVITHDQIIYVPSEYKTCNTKPLLFTNPTHHLSSNLVTDNAPKESSKKKAKENNLQCINTYVVDRHTNFQMYIHVVHEQLGLHLTCTSEQEVCLGTALYPTYHNYGWEICQKLNLADCAIRPCT